MHIIYIYNSWVVLEIRRSNSNMEKRITFFLAQACCFDLQRLSLFCPAVVLAGSMCFKAVAVSASQWFV